MAVVGSRKPRQTLRAFPKPSYLDAAVGGYITTAASGPLHAKSLLLAILLRTIFINEIGVFIRNNLLQTAAGAKH